MKKFAIILVIFIVLLSFSMLYGQTKIIINASDLPPLGSPNLVGNGILPQFISESFKGKNYTIEYKFLPYARVLAYMEKDTLGAGIFNSIRANDKLYNMKPIINSSVVFFYKKSKFPKGLPFNELKDLKQYSIGIVRGAPTIKKFEDAGLALDLVRDEALNFKKLQANRVDLVATIDIFGWYAIHMNGANINNYDVSESLLRIQTCFIISKSVPNSNTIIDDFSKGFEAAKNNKKLEAILEAFLGKDKLPIGIIP